ncbi:MAG TPA: nitronate monooxygenase [Cyclobacteriaceae bacterium]|nr:nitronate monooxygenase [Cyclobacteriaceae bacterium]
MNWPAILTDKLNVAYPIVQAPMFGVTTPAMVAAAANVGCLGSLALADMPPEKCIENIRATKLLTSLPFSVNLFVNDIPKIDERLKARYASTKNFIERLAAEHHLELSLPSMEQIELISYQEQVDAILGEGIKSVSFTFGNLDDPTIEKFKNHGVVLIGTCTSVEEAKLLEQSGIDIVCVQGIEAGGHRGSFVGDRIPQVAGISLLSQVRDEIKAPLIYAGGIYNARTLLAAQTLGAQGFQVGSLLLGSTESALKEFEKEKLQNVDESEIVLTRSFSGRYARGIKNKFIEAIENSRYILPYPYQNKLTGELRKLSKENQNLDFVSIWLGQSVNGYRRSSTGDLLQELIKEVESHSPSR